MMASAAVVDDEAGKSGMVPVVVVVNDFAFVELNRLAVDNDGIDRHLKRHFYRNRKDDEDHNNWVDDVHLNSYRIDYYARCCVHTHRFHRASMLDVADDGGD